MLIALGNGALENAQSDFASPVVISVQVVVCGHNRCGDVGYW